MKTPNPALMEQFSIEVAENLKRMEQALMQLHQTPGEPELIRELFRACHGIKGIAGYVDAEEIGLLSHEAESLLNQVQKAAAPLTPEQIGLMLDCHDELHQMLSLFGAGQPIPLSWRALLERFKSGDVAVAAGSSSSSVVEVGPSVTSGEPTFASTASFATVGASRSTPAPATKAISSEVGDVVGQQLSGLAIFFEKWQPGPIPAPLRQAIKRKLTLIKKSVLEHEEILPLIEISLLRLEQQASWKAEEITAYRAQLESLPALLSPSGPSKNVETFSPEQGLSVSVRSSRLHQLSTQVAEMTIIHNQMEYQLEQLSEQHPQLERELRPLRQEWARVIQSIEKTTQSLHMVQLKELFDRVPRIVRQLAKESGKRVELTIRGAHTEVDRATVSRLGDPITHIIRNAIDHGLESPDERLRHGKAESCTILIDAYAVGKSVFVDLFDDGRGIDVMKIREKAVEREFITAYQGSRMTEDELLHLIFEPGFSSKEEVTEVSGRGVGMDAVRKRLRELNGDVQVRSEVGHGTMMRLTFPNTYTLVKSLLLRCDEQLFAVPIQYAKETLHIRSQQLISLQGNTWIQWKGALRPIYDLEEILSLPRSPVAEKRKHAVVLGVDEREILLRVDQLVDTTVLSVNSLPLHLQDLEYYSGMTTVGAGKIVFFLHPLAILNTFFKPSNETGEPIDEQKSSYH